MAENRNYLELAKKLKALADRGIGGEKINAAEQLKKLIAKHGISLEDIESETLSDHFFDVQVKTRKIFIQVCAYVIGINARIYFVQNGRGKKKPARMLVVCTSAQAVEIESMYYFYSKDYLEQIKTFELAYIYKNNLVPQDGTVYRNLSDDEIQKRKKAAAMGAGIDKKQYLKELTP